MALEFFYFPELAQNGVPFCRVHLGRLERAGEFPKRIRLSANRVAWLRDEIEEWKRRRIAARSCSASVDAGAFGVTT